MDNIQPQNNEESFDSEAIRVDLNGPITSIEAVAQNLPRADGRSEWEHLLGKPLDVVITRQDFDIINKTIEEEKIKAGVQADYSETFNQRMDIMVEAFRKHEPELVQKFEELYNLPESAPASLLDNKLKGDLFSLLDFNKRSDSEGAIQFQNDEFSVLIRDPKASPENAVSGTTGIPEDELPPVPGSSDFWHARMILHELEHFQNQNFKYRPDAPEDIGFYDSTLREIDSDFAASKLLEPHATPQELEYLEHIRIIGTINKLTREPQDEGREAHYVHAIGHPLAHMDDIRANNYSVLDHFDDLDSLTIQVREELGVHDDNTLIRKDDVTFREMAQAVQNVFNNDTAARGVISDENSVEPLLSDEEREIAQQFLTAVDEAGFNAMWDKNAALNQDKAPTTESVFKLK